MGNTVFAPQLLHSLIMMFLTSRIGLLTGLAAARNVQGNPSCKLKKPFNHQNRTPLTLLVKLHLFHLAVTPNQRMTDIMSHHSGFHAEAHTDNHHLKWGCLRYLLIVSLSPTTDVGGTTPVWRSREEHQQWSLAMNCCGQAQQQKVF